MSARDATLYTTALAIVAACSQLAYGPITAKFKNMFQRSALIVILGLIGLMGFVPLMLGLNTLSNFVVAIAVVLIGSSAGIRPYPPTH